jgi:long-chain acyl-CoA synthetase
VTDPLPGDLSAVLRTTAQQSPDRPFLLGEGEPVTFADLDGRADRCAAGLAARGIAPGDRVAVAGLNTADWLTLFFGATRLGAAVVTLNVRYRETELDYMLGQSGARLVVTPAELAGFDYRALYAGLAPRLPHLESVVFFGDDGPDGFGALLATDGAVPDVPLDESTPAVVLYTSGTTGRPKGAVSTHRAVLQALAGFGCRTAVVRVLHPDEAPTTPAPPVFILIVPLFHVTGFVPVLLSCVGNGLKLVMMYRWDADRALELIERERVTNFVGVPTQSWDLLESPRFAETDTSSLVSVGGGGAPAPPELVKRVSSSFRQGRPSIGYGMTETNAYGPQNSGTDYESHPTSTGRATPILEISVRDDDGSPMPVGSRGEIWFKGPHLIRGFWNRPDATAEAIVDGWLRTGDIGRVDDEGFVYVEDRAKDMVLRGGENVYCTEVEAAIYEHPSVYEAAVFGVPHERLGEEVAAAVYLRPGVTLTAEELRRHVGERLAPFKVPSRVLVLDHPLPRNASGKILKRELRDEVSSG